MLSSIIKIFLIVLLSFSFTGCGGGGGGSGSSTSTSAGGAGQKGPFKQGSTVTAYKLDKGVRSAVNTATIRTTDNLGHFSITLSWSGATEFEIEGEYLDENTGTYISGGKLSAIVKVTAGVAQSININIFTHHVLIKEHI